MHCEICLKIVICISVYKLVCQSVMISWYTMRITNKVIYPFARSLEPVTQLYVSVDASTKDSLKKIDRPLFKDFWQRFLDSLTALAEKVKYGILLTWCYLTQM